MLNLVNTMGINSNILPKKQEQNVEIANRITNNKDVQNDFSWKYGTPWEDTSDEELAKINTTMNNAFKVLVKQYNESVKNVSLVENSIEKQLDKDMIDENELNEFISKNTLPLVNAFVDKDVVQIYKTSANLDEFKAKWLELKNQQITELMKMFLQMGFKSDFADENFSVKTELNIKI